jgi:SAM-dependent methyltransferase
MNTSDKNSKRAPDWDERYANGKYSASAPHKLLVSLVEKLKAGKALDLACGTGRHAIFLAQKGWRVTAVDNSTVGIGVAGNRAAEKALEIDFRVADLEADDFKIEENSFDLICDFYYLQRDLFAEMKKGLKTGGVIAAAIHIYGEGEKKGRFLLREGELKEIFRDFEILHYHETPATDPDAGEHHRRTAEIVCRKTGDRRQETGDRRQKTEDD